MLQSACLDSADQFALDGQIVGLVVAEAMLASQRVLIGSQSRLRLSRAPLRIATIASMRNLANAINPFWLPMRFYRSHHSRSTR